MRVFNVLLGRLRFQSSPKGDKENRMARGGLTRSTGTRRAGRRTPAVLAAAAVLGLAVALGSANAQAPPPPGASETEVLQYIEQLESQRPPEPDPVLPEAPTAEEQLDIDGTADDEQPVAPAPPPEPPDPPEAPTAEAPAPVEPAPAPLAVEPSAPAEAVPPAVEPVAPVEAPPATVETQPVLPIVEAPAIEAPETGRERADSPRRGRPVVETAPVEAPVAPVEAPAADPVAAAPPAVETVPVAQAETPAQDASVPSSGRVHVVQAGESLWSIAAELLGPGASTGEIARAVERLWQLNAERIGSGDPDLIMAGERLLLPAGL